MVLVGKKAPVFTAPAVIEGNQIIDNFSLEQYIGKKYIVLFFYPADFTFVCPTEILSYQELMPEFEKRDAVVIGCSTDSKFTHYQWLNTPVENGGIQGVKYPLVADQNLQIAYNYGVLAGNFTIDEEGNLGFEGDPVAYRATFIIDKEGIVRHQMVNDLFLGRNTHEALRVLDGIQYYEKHGEVCPADWEEGKEAMKPDFEGVKQYLAKEFKH